MIQIQKQFESSVVKREEDQNSIFLTKTIVVPYLFEKRKRVWGKAHFSSFFFKLITTNYFYNFILPVSTLCSHRQDNLHKYCSGRWLFYLVHNTWLRIIVHCNQQFSFRKKKWLTLNEQILNNYLKYIYYEQNYTFTGRKVVVNLIYTYVYHQLTLYSFKLQN